MIASSPPYIYSAPHLPEGREPYYLSEYNHLTFEPASAVLCRNNAPIISLAYYLLRRKVNAQILGANISGKFVKIVKSLGPVNAATFIQRLDAWKERALRTKSEDYVFDTYACLKEFGAAKEEFTSASLCDEIVSFFQKTRSHGVLLSTIHKAKGLEWEKVYLLDRKLIGERAITGAEQKQERNLFYVAITRSRGEVVFITSEGRR